MKIPKEIKIDIEKRRKEMKEESDLLKSHALANRIFRKSGKPLTLEDADKQLGRSLYEYEIPKDLLEWLGGVHDLKAEQCQACQYKTTDHEKMIRHKEKYCPAKTKENEKRGSRGEGEKMTTKGTEYDYVSNEGKSDSLFNMVKKPKSDITKLQYTIAIYRADSNDYIDIRLRIKRPRELANKDYDELNALKKHMNLYQFISWLEMKSQNLPAEKPDQWGTESNGIPYPFIQYDERSNALCVSYEKWSSEVRSLKDAITDLDNSWKEKYENLTVKYEKLRERLKENYDSKILMLELENEKLRRNLSAYQKTTEKKKKPRNQEREAEAMTEADMRPIKAKALMYPDPVRTLILSEPDSLPLEDFLAKSSQWIKLLKMEAEKR